MDEKLIFINKLQEIQATRKAVHEQEAAKAAEFGSRMHALSGMVTKWLAGIERIEVTFHPILIPFRMGGEAVNPSQEILISLGDRYLRFIPRAVFYNTSTGRVDVDFQGCDAKINNRFRLYMHESSLNDPENWAVYETDGQGALVDFLSENKFYHLMNYLTR